ncbi:MAG: hypothetical protein WCI18_00210 [Pseudomonadota bacterium]
MNQIVKKLTAWILLISQLALVPTVPLISQQDHIDLATHYSNLAKETAQAVLTLSGIKNASVSASATMEFNNVKLEKDAKIWYDTQISAASEKSQEILAASQTNFTKLLQLAQDEQKKRDVEIRKEYEILREKERIAAEEASKKALESSKNTTRPAAKAGDSNQDSTRMGILNIGAQDIDFKDGTSGLPQVPVTNVFPVTSIVVPPQGAPLSVGINSSSNPETQLVPFTFKAADYLSKVNITLVLGSEVPEKLVKSIISRVDIALDLGKISSGKPTIDWIKVEKVELEPTAPMPSLKEFMKSLLGPSNFFVSGVSMALILGIFVLGSALLTSTLLKKGIQNATSTLGQGISSLKPPTDSDGEEKTENDADSEGDNEISAADAEASNHATTAELGNIREQLTKLIEIETYACAEVIKDIFYEDSGFTDFRDLVVFIGYSSLRPVIELIPKTTVEKMLGFVEENKDVEPNILNGARISQAVYSEVIAKVSFKSPESKLLEPVKEALIRVEDNVLDAFMRTATSMEVALILRSLSNERSTRVVQNIQTEVLKEALQKLGDESKTWEQVIPNLIRKIAATAEKIIVKSLAHQRLILKLVKNATLDQEEMIYELIPSNDFELKRQVIKTKLLFKDLKYVPQTLFDKAFAKLPIKVRAQIVIAADEELKKVIFKAVTAGTRKFELLQAEVSELERNEKRVADIKLNRISLFGELMFEIRAMISDNPQWIELILKAQADELNLDAPSGIDTITAA